MLKLELENKEYQIPENADELSLERFDVISQILNSNDNQPMTKQMVLDITCALTGIDKEIILSAPAAFFDLLVEKTKWVYSLNLDGYKISDYIIIEGERYSFEKSEDISLREWVDIDTVLSKFPVEDKNAAILAIRIRKQLKNEDGKYYNKIEKYNTDMIGERKDMFKSLPVSTVFPLLGFFLSKEKILSNSSKLYSLQVAQALERQYQLQDWAKSSDGIKHWSNWRKTIFLKWMKFSTEELSKHVHFSHTLSKETERKMTQ